MTEMVERVARAIAQCRAFPCRGDDGVFCVGDCYCKAVARLAIETMRKPTNEMSDAGSRFLRDLGAEHTGDFLYEAMIDAALGGHG